MKRILLVFLFGGLALALSSWGFLVHRTVNQLALYRLPAGLRGFFLENKEYLVRHSVRPDQRRNTDSLEAPRHFIDLEAYGDSAAWKMPNDWGEAMARYSRDTLYKYGYVPYQIVMEQERLVRAFRNLDRDSILYYAADLSHYIADAHVPLHTTLNYDGQLTRQRGLHALWESQVPDLMLEGYDLFERGKARYLHNPAASAWEAVRSGFALLEGVLQQEREASGAFTDSTKYRIQVRNRREMRFYTDAFALAYGNLLGTTINNQLKKSAGLIADYWYSAWVDAGQPDLQLLMREEPSAESRLQARRELKAYRRNQLIEKNWLLSRKTKDSGN